ncbi:similar to Saccharomyces cerevisiae YJR152W DAL5 Allantoate permease [Maudiozyma barnettii]|uniref:Similar to Saccharomyces cerevisiae YJR152W DAL5 Allantoate permease n=1 Tax=Maudiozyma barnettii TaxID=61262 RepID=A0A8H2VGG0_9SACH|nr:allantoate permease [Kazachstania barnettii]CAB4255199.1 similar to Saccharomyces cerevisiae YJR152W DAL5 Allantoate permease [Kazachstania barnettii]CAD1783487.1 similar to Saccharomyces cerevisiae YJR152W DAL5 Allantoate permease [Kazachstania barnettii]
MTEVSSLKVSSDENDYIDEKKIPHDFVNHIPEDVEVEPILSMVISPNGEEIMIDMAHADEALQFVKEAENIVVTPEEDRKLCWKIDMCMFPLMCLIYAVQFMDKIATSSAAVMGLREDLKMKGNQYSWVGSAFYFGYLFMNLGPVQLIFQKTKYMAKYLAVFIMIWGLILTCHAAPSVNYAAFIALRVLLGCAESVVTPCFTIITAQYWKTSEQFTRISIWFGMNGLGSIILNSMAYGIYIHQDTYQIKAWRLLFVITGVITIFLGILIYLWIPDDPSKARFLSREEKLMVVQRIRSNQQGFGNREIKKYQIIEALKDVRTWLYFAFTVSSNIPNGGISNFISILFHTDFGYSTKDTLLMGIPTGAVEIVGCPLFGILAVYAARKRIPFWQHRLTWAIFAAILALIASCMLGFANKSKGARLGGAYLWYISPVSFICVLSNISANSSGYTKKWTVSSINLVAYAAANLAGPQTFIAKQAPDYQGAKIAMVVCYACMIVILSILLFINVRENKRRDKVQEERGGPEKLENLEFADCTDFENPNFRYTL